MMNTRYKTIGWVLLGILVTAALVLAAFQLVGVHLGLAATASPSGPAAISAGQNAAIQGADQLLLLQPFYQRLFLPLLTH